MRAPDEHTIAMNFGRPHRASDGEANNTRNIEGDAEIGSLVQRLADAHRTLGNDSGNTGTARLAGAGGVAAIGHVGQAIQQTSDDVGAVGGWRSSNRGGDRQGIDGHQASDQRHPSHCRPQDKHERWLPGAVNTACKRLGFIYMCL